LHPRGIEGREIILINDAWRSITQITVNRSMLAHYGFFQVQECCHTITGTGTVRRGTKICRHMNSLVKIGTTSVADSLVEILISTVRRRIKANK
jgi:hypothetical protein